MLIDADLLQFQPKLNTKKVESRTMIWDVVRSKWLILAPEELVRQLLLIYLIEAQKYPKNKIAVEKALEINGMLQRFDALVYDNNFKPAMLIECKAPKVAIKQEVFDQISRYNIALKVDYLVVTNGVDTFCTKMNYSEKSYTFLEDLPTFEVLTAL